MMPMIAEGTRWKAKRSFEAATLRRKPSSIEIPDGSDITVLDNSSLKKRFEGDAQERVVISVNGVRYWTFASVLQNACGEEKTSRG
jgi:hypothetical protein